MQRSWSDASAVAALRFPAAACVLCSTSWGCPGFSAVKLRSNQREQSTSERKAKENTTAPTLRFYALIDGRGLFLVGTAESFIIGGRAVSF
jgi:hypothetical protein